MIAKVSRTWNLSSSTRREVSRIDYLTEVESASQSYFESGEEMILLFYIE